MNKNELLKTIRENGYEILADNLDFRKQDSILWFGLDDGSILTIKKDNHILSIIACGEIRIIGKRKKK